MPMKIGFIGAGKVGFSLGKYFVYNNIELSGFYSRTFENALKAAEFTDSKGYDSLKDIVEDSEVLFLTVSDTEIINVWDKLKELKVTGKIICHCSGVLSSEIFADIKDYNCFGYSIHPLLAVSNKETSYKEFSKALFTIEGSEEKIAQMTELFSRCGNKVRAIKAADKVRYHGAAVMASNLVLGLLETAIEELINCGFTREEAFEALSPLMLGNVLHLKDQTIEESLTGPVERNDILTVENHLDVLDGDNREIYSLLSKKALKIAKRKNSDRFYDKLDNILTTN